MMTNPENVERGIVRRAGASRSANGTRGTA